MRIYSRRELLRQTAIAAASSAAFSMAGARAFASPAFAPVKGWITDAKRRYQPIEMAEWKTSTPAAGTILIDPSRRFQSILGFGGAFTDASCYLLGKTDAAAREKLLGEFFGPAGLRLSMGRTCIGSSDYSRSAYSYDDSATPDPGLKTFSIDHDRAYILPTLRQAAQINPELFLFSTPWSPPGWMKAGNSLLGGSMRNHYFAAYAQYFVKFLQAYKAEGVTISAVTSQNEVDTDQDGRMPAALWGQEYEAGFIKGFLGPALRAAKSDARIWVLDHNYNLWGRVMDMLSDPEVFQYVDGVAWHGYYGTPDAMTRVHDAFPSKHTYWTEGGPDYTAPDYATDWASWSATYAGILKNWARCIVAWNLVLDEKGTPNIGPFNCGGLVTQDSKTGEITRSGQYWAFAHYSKAIRRNASVIATSGGVAEVEHVAVVNPDGGYVLVLTNQGAEREVLCSFAGKSLAIEMPAKSVATLQWT